MENGKGKMGEAENGKLKMEIGSGAERACAKRIDHYSNHRID
jgi:hypothetical protein